MRAATSCCSSRRRPSTSSLFSIFPLALQPGHQLLRLEPDHPHASRSSGSTTTSDLLADPVFWQAVGNTAILVGARRRHPGRAGHRAGALLRPPSAGHRGSCAASSSCPCCSRRSSSGLMWRALAQPRLGHGQLGPRRARPAPAALARRSVDRALHAGPRRLLAVDAVHLRHRLRAAPGAAPGRVRGGRGRRRRRTGRRSQHVTLPLLAPAIVFAAVFRAIDAFRSFDIVFGLTYGGPGRLHHDAELLRLGERLQLHALRLLRRRSRT